jgi:mannonate dehydratase
MMDRLGDRVHFLHLRNVRATTTRSAARSSRTSIWADRPTWVALVAAVLREEARRREAAGPTQ